VLVSHKTGRYVIVLVLALWAVTAAEGQRKPRILVLSSPGAVRHSAGTDSAISISLVPLSGGALVPGSATGQSTLQLGRVSSGGGSSTAGVVVDRHPHSMVVRTIFGIQLNNHGGAQGSASLSAFLLNSDPRCQVYLDGIKLESTPRLIQRGIRYMAVSQHRLEIEVPNTVTESQGNIARNIGFLAVSD
jgi:hypothetical protein